MPWESADPLFPISLGGPGAGAGTLSDPRHDSGSGPRMWLSPVGRWWGGPTLIARIFLNSWNYLPASKW